MSIQEYEEKLAGVAAEIEGLEGQRPEVLKEIGEKVLAEFRDKPEFEDLVKKFDGIDGKIEGLRKEELKLKEGKLQAEKEEKEALIMRTCAKCKHVNPDDAKFCEECGGPLGVLPREYCRECGTLNHQGLKFCGECGAKLAEE